MGTSGMQRHCPRCPGKARHYVKKCPYRLQGGQKQAQLTTGGVQTDDQPAAKIDSQEHSAPLAESKSNPRDVKGVLQECVSPIHYSNEEHRYCPCIYRASRKVD